MGNYALIRINARNGRELASGFLKDIQDGLCDIEGVRPVDETRAIDLLRRYVDKKYWFCAALSFVVMEHLALPKRWRSMTISGAMEARFRLVTPVRTIGVCNLDMKLHGGRFQCRDLRTCVRRRSEPGKLPAGCARSSAG